MNSDWLLKDFFLLSLATWRVSYMLAREDGPFNRIFLRLRKAVGVVYQEEEVVDEETGEEQIESSMTATNWLSEGLICMWCNSVWIGLAWTILYFLFPLITRFMAFPLALSTISIILLWLKVSLTRSEE